MIYETNHKTKIKNKMIRKFTILALLIFLNISVIKPQTPDTSPPDTYKEVLPGYKKQSKIVVDNKPEENQPQKEVKKEQPEKPKKEIINEEPKKTFSIKELLENKNLVNIILLIIIFIIFFIYRIRK